MCETPLRSPTIVGIAVETIVWSRLDTSMPAISAEKIRLIRRRVSTMGAAAPAGATVVGGADTRLLGGQDVVAAGAAGDRVSSSATADRARSRWCDKGLPSSASNQARQAVRVSAW